MSKLDTITDPAELAAHLEECDAAFEEWDCTGVVPLPDNATVRAALERVHGTGGHALAEQAWEEAFEKGHSDGVGRVAREYARIVRWIARA